jgi:hypothetical protein
MYTLWCVRATTLGYVRAARDAVYGLVPFDMFGTETPVFAKAQADEAAPSSVSAPSSSALNAVPSS